MFRSHVVISSALVGVDLGESFDVVADPRCDGRERLASVELGAGEPVAEVVQAHLLGACYALDDSAERLGESVRRNRREAGRVGEQVGQDEGVTGQLGSDVGRVGELIEPVLSKHFGRPGIDGDFSDLVALGVLVLQLAGGQVGDRFSDRDAAAVEVDGAPPHAADLASACSGGGQEAEGEMVLRIPARLGLSQDGGHYLRRGDLARDAGHRWGSGEPHDVGR